MKTHAIAALVASLLGGALLTGCSMSPPAATPGELFRCVQPGMSRAEVDALLGAPLQARSTAVPRVVGDTEAWYLPPHAPGPVDSAFAPGTIGVTFTHEGKVMSTRLNPRCREGDDACSVDEVSGHYLCMRGSDIWDELELSADGRCTWWSCSCARLPTTRTATAGSWRLERGHAILAVTPAPNVFALEDEQLVVRRWWGHVYLVPRRHVAWFDSRGPMDEFCFARDVAPLVVFPPANVFPPIESR